MTPLNYIIVGTLLCIILRLPIEYLQTYLLSGILIILWKINDKK